MINETSTIYFVVALKEKSTPNPTPKMHMIPQMAVPRAPRESITILVTRPRLLELSIGLTLAALSWIPGELALAVELSEERSFELPRLWSMLLWVLSPPAESDLEALRLSVICAFVEKLPAEGIFGLPWLSTVLVFAPELLKERALELPRISTLSVLALSLSAERTSEASKFSSEFLLAAFFLFTISIYLHLDAKDSSRQESKKISRNVRDRHGDAIL